jgi:cytochrome c oxidase subunit 4
MSDTTATAHGHDEHGAHDDGAVHAHISPWTFLVAIFGALIVLTLLTVAASYVNFGSANTIIAILIATVKASLVALFFMHLRYDKPFLGFIFVAAFGFLGLFLLLTMDDLGTRGRVDDAAGVHILPRTGQEAPGGMAGQYVPNENPGGQGEHTQPGGVVQPVEHTGAGP